MAQAQFRHQEFGKVPRGWQVKTVKRGRHEARIAFPPGKRKKGAGRLISLLHPMKERNPEPECLFIVDDAIAETGAPELGTPEEKALATGICRIVARPVTLNGNPKSKTREALEKMQAKAVRFLRDVVGDDDKADDIDGMTVEEYADKKHIHLANKKRQYAKAQRRNVEKSKGHLGFTDQHEYFRVGSGDIYRAPKTSALDTDGYRMGARFESTKTAWDSLGKKLVSFSNKKRNLDEVADAQRVYETFQGRESVKVTTLHEPDKQRDDFAHLGWLTRLMIQPITVNDPEPVYGEDVKDWRDQRDIDVLTVSNWKELADEFGIDLVGLAFDPAKEQIRVTSAASGSQIYFIGGNQDVTESLDQFEADLSKDRIVLGYLIELVYENKEKQKDSSPVVYGHILAEDGGLQPIAVWDKLSKRILLDGGDYQVGQWIEN